MFASGVKPSSGASELSDLSDVNVPTPNDDDHMVFDTGSGLWLPEAAAAGGGHTYVHRDLPATPDFVSTHNEGGTMTSQNDFHLIDSAAGFVTAGIYVGSWVHNWNDASYAQVTVVNSPTDLTLDTNIFPADDGDGYNTYGLRHGAWHDLDLSSIVDAGSVLVKVHVHLDSGTILHAIWFRKNGDTGTLEINGAKMEVANVPKYATVLVACDANRIAQYKLHQWDTVCNLTIGGWWKA